MDRAPAGSGRSWTLPVVVFAPPLLLLAAAAGVAIAIGRPPGDFVRDPTATLGAHPLTGFVSGFTVLAWWTGAVVAGWAWLDSRGRAVRRPELGRFFLAAAALTALLALDDLFLFHETLAPGLGVPERVVLAAYAVAAAAFAVRFGPLLTGTRCRRNLLLAAVGFFAGSLAVDYLSHLSPSEWRVFVEDGLKLLGVCAWTGYLARSAWLLPEAALSPSSPMEPPP